MPGSFCNLLYHLVFSTKERQPLIDSQIKEPLHSYIGGIVRDEKGTLIEADGTSDHLHLLVRLHPTTAVAELLRLIKANSSKWINERFRLAHTFEWQKGYAAFSVSQSQSRRVATYIQRQEEHHRKQDFKTELIALLKRHEIEFDERYLR